MRIRACAVLAAIVLAACSSHAPHVQTTLTYPIPVVTTISTLNSFVRGVGGNFVSVQSLVPVGASPETYEPTPQSVAMLSGARLLVENGAGLETWLGGLLQNAGNGSIPIVDGSQGLPVIGHNPHLWMDPQYAKQYVARIATALSALDPKHRVQYARNAAAYEGRLDALTSWIRSQVDTVPRSRRLLVVFHNAWQYYDDRFGITTLGIIEEAPGQEPNPHDFGRTVDLAKAHHVHAIFSEPEYSPKLAQTLAHDAGIGLVENLYDDSIGMAPDVSNYIAMLHYDTREIVKSMR